MENQNTNAHAEENVPEEKTLTANAIPKAIPKKVKILDTNYTKVNNLVEWKVEFDTGKQLVLAIPGEELGYLLGFDFIFNDDLILQACEAFKGKEKFLLICGDENNIPDDIKKAEGQEDVLSSINNKINDYPFSRVAQNIYDGNIDSLRMKLVEHVNRQLEANNCRIQIIKRNDTSLAEKFYFVGVWKSQNAESFSEEDINEIFNTISSISHTYGLIAERPDDFESGFFSLRQMV